MMLKILNGWRTVLKTFPIKILKFLFSKEKEIAPGVFYLGGYCYENRNPPKGNPPLKFKKRK